ncbi:MAG: hypothetical protein ACXAAH_06620 [Promethearchaeota archaeon]|jgi:hypothetical protein
MGDMENILYELGLHETVKAKEGFIIMRVPGGWIYDCWDFNTDSFKSGTFVPYDDEFKPKIS